MAKNTTKAFDHIMEGLTDALAYAEGDRTRGKAHEVEVPAVDVKAARKKLGLSQDKFAAVIGVPAPTVKKWEQGQRQPDAAARALFRVIEHEPEAVMRALAAE